MRLGRIGFDNVAGYLSGGMFSLDARPELITTTQRITAPTLGEQLQSEQPPVVLDVRSAKERDDVGFVEGSIHIPLNHLEERIAEVTTNRAVVVHCAGGYRSVIACSLLQRKGIECTDLVGGFKAWIASKQPVIETARAS